VLGCLEPNAMQPASEAASLLGTLRCVREGAIQIDLNTAACCYLILVLSAAVPGNAVALAVVVWSMNAIYWVVGGSSGDLTSSRCFSVCWHV